jgi:hypothetical protein
VTQSLLVGRDDRKIPDHVVEVGSDPPEANWITFEDRDIVFVRKTVLLLGRSDKETERRNVWKRRAHDGFDSRENSEK